MRLALGTAGTFRSAGLAPSASAAKQAGLAIRSLPRQAHSTTSQILHPAKAKRRRAWVTGATGAGCLTFSLLGLALSESTERSPTSRELLPDAYPDITTSSSLPKASTPAAARALTVEEATAKLRAGEGSLLFDAGDGRKGRFDYVRYASNSPVEDDYSFGSSAGPGGSDNATWRYWGIYDGHAGWATSSLLRGTLIPYTATHLAKLPQSFNSEDVTRTIKAAFTGLDNEFLQNAAEAIKFGAPLPEAIAALAPAVAGSCALLSIFDPVNAILRVACVGDSRAVLGTYSTQSKSYSARAMSKDQTGFNAKEVARITAAHPDEDQDDIIDPNSGRLLGIAVTRAFGDHRWKWTQDSVIAAQERFFGSEPRPKSKTPPYMTAEPVVEECKVVRGDDMDFLIMASDGLWDHISNEDAVTCVEQWIRARRNGAAQLPAPATRDTTRANDKPDFELENGNFATWKVKPEQFVVEDENAATHLVKNAFGGSNRRLFITVVSAYNPVSRNIRDDITVNVIFFGSAE